MLAEEERDRAEASRRRYTRAVDQLRADAQRLPQGSPARGSEQGSEELLPRTPANEQALSLLRRDAAEREEARQASRSSTWGGPSPAEAGVGPRRSDRVLAAGPFSPRLGLKVSRTLGDSRGGPDLRRGPSPLCTPLQKELLSLTRRQGDFRGASKKTSKPDRLTRLRGRQPPRPKRESWRRTSRPCFSRWGNWAIPQSPMRCHGCTIRR
eukprot:3701950-Amphidinium_carterae.2